MVKQNLALCPIELRIIQLIPWKDKIYRGLNRASSEDLISTNTCLIDIFPAVRHDLVLLRNTFIFQNYL